MRNHALYGASDRVLAEWLAQTKPVIRPYNTGHETEERITGSPLHQSTTFAER